MRTLSKDKIIEFIKKIPSDYFEMSDINIIEPDNTFDIPIQEQVHPDFKGLRTVGRMKVGSKQKCEFNIRFTENQIKEQ
jgi:hypothetical protein